MNASQRAYTASTASNVSLSVAAWKIASADGGREARVSMSSGRRRAAKLAAVVEGMSRSLRRYCEKRPPSDAPVTLRQVTTFVRRKRG
jgi:hypothetical protein